MFRSKWFKYFIEVFNLTFLVGLFWGIVVSLIGGSGYEVSDFIPGLVGSINHSFIIVFLSLSLYLFLSLALSRLIRHFKWSCFIATAILITPLFLFWGYRINKVYFHGFSSLEAMFWNSIIALAFISLWFLISKGLLFWTRSSILETRPVSLGRFGLLLAIVVILNISTFILDDLNAANLEEEKVAVNYLPQVKPTKGIAYDAANRNPETHQFYRFDDRLNDAIVTEASSPMVDENEIGFEFDGKDGRYWRPINQNHVSTSVKNGLLEIAVKNQSAGIESIDNLKIPAEMISGIALRMGVTKGENFKLMWKQAGEQDFDKSKNIDVRSF